ncbi:chromosomal replication initiator protein DnaA [bacterium]|nr:chromosomal replication initiator protein DnaA [bacterium]
MHNERVTNSKQWKDCLAYMARRVKEGTFNTWLRPTKGEPGSNGDFKIAVPNQFVADWIKDHFGALIDEALAEVLGRTYDTVYVLTGQPDPEDQTVLEFADDLAPTGGSNGSRPGGGVAPAVGSHHGNGHNLNSRYTFSTLVVGDFNQFACAASMAVAEESGANKYNPLYIYGGTGLGKTHIIQAIGNEIMLQYPEKRVFYATSEKFTSDFISSISDRSINDFIRMYREVDVLIIDDIQFFTGKESTQEQFFHTFNALYHNGKQIILSSDRPPRDIRGLEDRLLSRFSWGLVTDLQAPDLENRTAILYKKLESEGKKTIPDNVVRFIAEKIKANIRELEGALIRVLAYASLKGVPVDLEMTRKVLSDAIEEQRAHVTVENIQAKTAEFFSVALEMMSAKKKTAHIALARQVAMYLSRSLTDNSLKAIGDAFGGRDHSTVIHACDLVAKRMATDGGFREKIDKLSASLLY